MCKIRGRRKKLHGNVLTIIYAPWSKRLNGPRGIHMILSTFFCQSVMRHFYKESVAAHVANVFNNQLMNSKPSIRL